MFTTGTSIEGAVSYTSTDAVCGSALPTDFHPTNATNKANFTLPKLANCPQPIGARFIANLSRILVAVIDAGGQIIGAPNTCWDAYILLNAIKRIAATSTPMCLTELTTAGITPAAGNVKMYVDDSGVTSVLKVWDCKTSTYLSFSAGGGANIVPVSVV